MKQIGKFCHVEKLKVHNKEQLKGNKRLLGLTEGGVLKIGHNG